MFEINTVEEFKEKIVEGFVLVYFFILLGVAPVK